MQVAIYARVSTSRQSQAQTIEQQLDRLSAHVQAQGWELSAHHIFRDDGYSGATLRRPGLDGLRDLVAAGAVERVLITAPDRLARNYVHQVLLIEELQRFGAIVEFLDRAMSQDPHDQLLLQIRGAVAEYERTLIAERMRRGRLRKLQAGLLLPWTRVPYGYRVSLDRPRDPGGVRVDPVEGAVIQQIFAQYLEAGSTLLGLVKSLQQQGICSPRGNSHWTASTLRWLLINPVYLGQVYSGRTRGRPAQGRRSALEPLGRQGLTLEMTPPARWTLVATIPPIISQEQFDQVQVKLTESRQRARRNNKTQEYLLRALVSCGVCGYACTGRREPPSYAYYLCAGKHPGAAAARCPARFIPTQQLDEVVWHDLYEVLTHPESIRHALERAQDGQWVPQELQARREQVRQGRLQLERQRERLTDAYQSGVLPLDEYQQRRQAVEQQMGVLDRQAQQIASQVDQQKELAGVLTSIEAFCQRVQAGLENASFDQKRQLVELLIDRVIVTNGDVEIRYVIPTSPSSEHVSFSHLRTNYLHCRPRPVVPRQQAPLTTAAQEIEDPVEDQAQVDATRTPTWLGRRQEQRKALPLAV
jgi:site-specific DNA recombinase